MRIRPGNHSLTLCPLSLGTLWANTHSQIDRRKFMRLQSPIGVANEYIIAIHMVKLMPRPYPFLCFSQRGECNRHKPHALASERSTFKRTQAFNVTIFFCQDFNLVTVTTYVNSQCTAVCSFLLILCSIILLRCRKCKDMSALLNQRF